MEHSSTAAHSQVEAINARWREAQRSPSIIGFNVASELGDRLQISLDGASAPVADVRLWEGAAGEGSADRVFLELLFPGAPAAWEESRVGEECAKVVEAHLQEQRVTEFRAKLARRQEQSTMRRRGASASSVEQVEGGDVSEDSWRSYLRKPAADTELRVHGVLDIGGRGRRVLAVQLSMSATAGEELGRLAYPRIFEDEASKDPEREDRDFMMIYGCCITFLVLLFLLWLCFMLRGLFRHTSAAGVKT